MGGSILDTIASGQREIDCCVCSVKQKFVPLECLAESHTAMRCPECEIVRVWPPAKKQDDLTDAYLWRAQEEARWRWFAEDTYSFLKKQIGGLPKSLLDIGCSTGVIVEIFSQHGWLAKGVDIDQRAVEYGRNHGRCLTVGTIDSLNEKFDVVILSHLFEHLAKPGIFLDAAVQRLAANGYLFIMTPTYKSMPGRWYRGRWNGWVPGQHEWIYTRNSIRRLLEMHGFRSIKIWQRVHRGWPEDGWWRKAFWWKRLPLILAMRLSGILGVGDGLYVLARM